MISALTALLLLFGSAICEDSEDARWYNSTRTPPPGFEHWVEYAKENRCAPGPYNNIDGDLAPFRDPIFPERRTITKELVEKAKAYALGKHDAALYRISNGTAAALWEEHIEYPAWAAWWGKLLADVLVELAPYLPDMELVVNLHDFPKVLKGDSDDVEARFDACTNASAQFRKFRHLHHTHGGQQLEYDREVVPIFSQTKVAGCHVDIQYPTMYNWNKLLSEEEQKQLLPWAERNDTIVFRGSTTGGHANPHPTREYQVEEYVNLHRFRLVEEFKHTPHTDFQFTGYIECHSICDKLKGLYGEAPMMPELDLLGNFKYLMAVEGNSFLSRWPRYLGSGALTFRAGLFREWFDEWMKPFDGNSGHYIPVSFDYSDLEAKLDWALTHDSLAENVAAAARDFAYSRVRNEDLKCYLWRLLLEYAGLLEL